MAYQWSRSECKNADNPSMTRRIVTVSTKKLKVIKKCMRMAKESSDTGGVLNYHKNIAHDQGLYGCVYIIALKGHSTQNTE